jgi:hypothetical protein
MVQRRDAMLVGRMNVRAPLERQEDLSPLVRWLRISAAANLKESVLHGYLTLTFQFDSTIEQTAFSRLMIFNSIWCWPLGNCSSTS